VKLIVPYMGRMTAVDAGLLRLAEFLGITCESLPLEKPADEYAGYLADAVPDQDSCLVICPEVIKQWTDGRLPPGLASFLCFHFTHLLLHAPGADLFDASLIAALSAGRFGGVEGIGVSESYEISADSQDICEAFAGISFGPANPANDRVFQRGSSGLQARTLISIGGQPLMAAMKRDRSEILFLGGADIADLDAEAADEMTDYFSRLLPYAMALRSIFGKETWRPHRRHACVIVDDPLLRQNYGFLNFDKLLGMMKDYNFHTTIAFIPHNFRRSSSVTGKMFREHSGYFSLCFHGNDHTGAEFAAADTALLNSMLQIAEHRIAAHSRTTGLDCSRVMVFPQGNFSVEAMSVLQSRNFDCAVNTSAYPMRKAARLTLKELAQPALLRYAGFPLFLRSKSAHIRNEGIAFNLFFGKPVLIVEHHDIFRDPQPLLEAVSRINSVAPGIHWSNLGDAAANSFLQWRAADGEHLIRAYSRTIRIANDGNSPARFAVEWGRGGDRTPVEKVLLDGTPGGALEMDNVRIRAAFEVASHTSRAVSLSYRNDYASLRGLGIPHKARAFFRRRLSEVRDDYLTKSQPALLAAKTLQRCFSRKY
jgi:hypothetical protein